ncbi:MAG: PD40 domain-containing protein, partial [Anaerolineae bacterium]|nr:PD40 domain-containing protein [Anaerolineae bacterium]
FTDYVSGAAFTTDSRRLVSVHMNGDVNIWDVPSLKLVKTYQTLLIGNSLLSIFPDNRRILLMSGGIPQRFLVVDTQTGAITKSIGKHFDSFMEFQTKYTQFPDMGDIQFASYALSPDGKQLATATANDEVGIWQIADNTYQQLQPAGEQYGSFAIRSMAFTKDGKTLVFSNTRDKKIHVWDVASKSEKASVDAVAEAIGLSPDGKMLVWTNRVQDQPGTISVAPLDALDQAKVLLTLAKDYKFGPRMTSVRFMPDGKQVVVSGLFASNEAPNQIYVLDVPS